ncbi:MAG: CRISPR-associated endonuclease Cas1 [Anaerolineales bacterium]|nr:CRISPR-associated endonuclease Cas1 [Anaerolineales bacterium]
MTQVHVREQGAKVHRRGDRLVVTKQRQVLDQFPLEKVEEVALHGNVQITTQAIAALLQRGVDVAFLSSQGTWRGWATGGESSHVELRQKQFMLLNDEQAALQVSKAIVDAKIHNQRVVLQRQAKRVHVDQAMFDKALVGMMAMKQQSAGAQDLDALRGYEGKAAVFYFAAIRALIDPAWGFAKREYYPPPDPFNALLSFSYSLLLKEVRTAIRLTGLEIHLGFFHAVSRGRPSLALDLMEEWRPLISDSLCLELINRGSLVPEEFVRTGRPSRPVELGDMGIVRVLEAYGSRLETRLFHPMAGPGGQTSLQNAIRLQAQRVARLVDGREAAYEPMRAK